MTVPVPADVLRIHCYDSIVCLWVMRGAWRWSHGVVVQWMERPPIVRVPRHTKPLMVVAAAGIGVVVVWKPGFHQLMGVN